jgi:hypothetical protein
VSGQPDPILVPPSPARAIAGLVVANSSLLIAVLVYMGWAYEDALYGYFHLRVLDLDVSVVEYVLRSLSLFSVTIVFAAVVFIIATAVRAWDLNRLVVPAAGWVLRQVPGTGRLRRPAAQAASQPQSRTVLIATGAAMTVAALALAGIARYVPVSAYLVLGLLAVGLPLMTWPTRLDRRGRFPYALAIVVAAVCGLWAGSVYAHAVGIGAAENLVRGLPGRTAVTVYSTQPLALSGPGVSEQTLGGHFLYRYRYQGLRLLMTRTGTYYVLPVGWSPRYDITYVLTDSDQIRIELY